MGRISADACAAMQLHAAKYAYTGVIGVLLGRAGGDAGDDEVLGDVTISHALPIAHGRTAATATLTIALALAAHHAKSESAELVGFYAANEIATDLVPGETVKRAAEKMMDSARESANKRGSALIVLLEPRELPQLSAMRVWRQQSRARESARMEWTRASMELTPAPNLDARALAAQLLDVRAIHAIADFEDAACSPQLDWLSPPAAPLQ